MKFIVKMHPEISIKSRSVRIRFTKILESNIKVVLRRVDEKAWVQKQWDCLEVQVSDHKREIAIERLQCIPGVAFFTEVKQSEFVDFDDTCQKVIDLYRSDVEGKTFCVRVKRRGHHDFSSKDLERYVGGFLNQSIESASVKLTAPQMTVRLEVANDKLFLMGDRFEGLGGFPIATQDDVLSLISGGYDSGVASYLTMRRGYKTHFIFFNLGGSAHEIGVKQVSYYLWEKYGVSHRVKFISVDFQPVVAEILENIDSGLMGVVLKRMMMRAASAVAGRMGYNALVTGEALGQVSSQTLINLGLIDKVTEQLIVRPLITTDKQEIIDIAKQIGTEDFAKTMPEYCGVISKKPNIAAKQEKVEATEANFYMPLIEQVVNDATVYDIRDLAKQAEQEVTEVASVSELSANHIIIDVRSDEEEENEPLEVSGAQIIHIPFFKLATKFADLAQDKHYLLYCKKGVMSRLQALYLHEQGFKNVSLFQPDLVK
ncbi:tRNA 4-thiouridine(8) synthase ThiI [Catenovulum sp. 2E275]|uniref:tRNA uracil 4-sulfurtransferase ThiI n=1 Tax=Catenovulum sp. 2E275 TaxID=2980497 RepID=UPI0021D2548F|nr:tRNA uracil 4-sulfurtransferase ThiI [Catenovulum sp. 2E275]MCU4675317.1 tRNA 4-thiouridine(8) synthase ThiI [Catenovulum sp. 2E275]